MLRTIIAKELKSILFSPKFVVTFAASSLLILLSVVVGIQEYRANLRAYQAAQELNRQSLAEQSWSGLATRAYRPPDPMQIFVSGVHNDIGRFSSINPQEEVKLRQSIYSDDPVFAVFRFIDFAFIVQVVLSLLAILFTYDAVNGERERGTLQLTFSNPVPRARYILGKFAGAWLGLAAPLIVPILLAALLILLFNVPMSSQDWGRVGSLLGISLLFFTFFIAFGTLMSTLTRSSSVSFLLSLVCWVFMVLIVPRAGVMMAGQLVEVPTVGEIESRQDGYARERWAQYEKELGGRWRIRRQSSAGMHTEDRTAFNRDKMAEWMREDTETRKQVTADIAEYARKLNEELRNLRSRQERLAFTLSRFSPASSYRLASMALAGTDIDLKSRAEDAMHDYRTQVLALSEQKSEGEESGRRMMVTSGRGTGEKPSFNISFADGSDRPTLDPSEVPVYDSPTRPLRAVAAPAVIDAGLLSLYTLAAFSAGFLAFLRYDVR